MACENQLLRPFPLLVLQTRILHEEDKKCGGKWHSFPYKHSFYLSLPPRFEEKEKRTMIA
jgi:hypothetical protein